VEEEEDEAAFVSPSFYF